MAALKNITSKLDGKIENTQSPLWDVGDGCSIESAKAKTAAIKAAKAKEKVTP